MALVKTFLRLSGDRRSGQNRRPSHRRDFDANPVDRFRVVRPLFEDRIYWTMVAWLTIVFLLGGSSRSDVLPLLLLRPLSVLVLAYGLVGLTAMQVRENRFLLGMAAAWLALPLLQLVPLPPAIWFDLPGRGIVRKVDIEAGLGDVWRPISMVPSATMNAVWALIVPIATLVLGIRIEEGRRAKLLAPIIFIGFLSGFLGIMQAIGDPDGPLYFYRFTNNGAPVGLLANRNHQAALLACLMPMLVAWALSSQSHGIGYSDIGYDFDNGRRAQLDRSGWTLWLPIFGGAAMIVPLILLTGSRTGIVLGLIGLLSLPMLGTLSRRSGSLSDNDMRSHFGKDRWMSLLSLLALIALAIVASIMGRAISIDRLLHLNTDDELRVHALPVILSLIKAYAPWGSGLGTFEQIYYIQEPDNLLSDSYMNHAHNDWVELALTGGMPGLTLALLGIIGSAWAILRLVTADPMRLPCRPLGLAGAFILVIFAVASATDYPLRVPSLACLGVVAALWVRTGLVSERNLGCQL